MEYQIKAAFLYNFTKFVEWPKKGFLSTTSPFEICIVGENPFHGYLKKMLEGKTVKSRSFHVQEGSTVDKLGKCHVIFLGLGESERTPELMGALKGSGALTVGEDEKFTQQGGMIRFYLEQNKIRFEINLTVVQQAHLKISSKLLNLAKMARE